MDAARKPLYRSLYLQVIVAIVIGVLLGHFYPQTGEAMKPLGDGFIKLIKMIIAPIIFCTVVVGIAGMEVCATPITVVMYQYGHRTFQADQSGADLRSS